ncbi:hypothetical protein SNEBB_003436 [Seison nebaliae]|nr:hypothetical protein SNEBB_003436 [Seison nebaliae]
MNKRTLNQNNNNNSDWKLWEGKRLTQSSTSHDGGVNRHQSSFTQNSRRREEKRLTLGKLLTRIVFSPLYTKLFIYLAIILFCSIIKEKNFITKTYFARKDNWLNILIGRIGWLLPLSLSIVSITSKEKCVHERNGKIWLRPIICSVIWFILNHSWNYLEGNYFGICLHELEDRLLPKFNTKNHCRLAGHSWKSFDISGHIFLLTFSLFMLNEEINSFRCCHGKTDTSVAFIRNKILLIFSGVTVIIYEVAYVCTSLYFHTFLEKIISFSIATLLWFFLYQIIFPLLDLGESATKNSERLKDA